MSSPLNEEAARVLVETLRLGRFERSVELTDIALKARVSGSFTKEVLTNILGTVDDTRISLGSTSRVRIAVEAARAGRLKDAAQAISWQEFEKFGEQCLEEAEFRTKRNVRVKDRRQALAVILTLREPPAQLSEDTILVSVEKLPSFLGTVTPYAENLPFMTSPLAVVENPMSQSS